MIVDLRLVTRRDGSVVAIVEGRLVPGIAAASLSSALALLARRLEGAAWAQRRDESAEVADARSALYVTQPPPVAPAPEEGGPSCR